jgi:TPR repeat protein
MIIDAEYLPYLEGADEGCPKCQYIMADHYMYGIGVPKDREKGKYYYKLLASNHPKDLRFLDACYSTLLLLIAYKEYADNNYDEAVKYFNSAMTYINQNYPPEEAKKLIKESEINKYMSVI